MKNIITITILILTAVTTFAQNKSNQAIVTPDGDIILPEVTIDKVEIVETMIWTTSYFYELTNETGQYTLKNGTKQEIERIITLDGKNNTLRVYDKKKNLKMHHDITTVIKSENQLILDFTNGAYMIIDNKNKTISLFEKYFGFVYKMD